MAGHGEILDISTDDLHSTAPAFSAQSKALREAAAKLKTTLDGLGAPWGGDEQGTKFHDAYAPQRRLIEKTAAILAEGLESIHLGMKDMADGHINNESLVEAMFTKPGREDSAK
jgi:hypothetical protein